MSASNTVLVPRIESRIQKIRRKAFPIAFDLLIKSLGLHPIQRSQVHIQHDPQAAYHLDTALNTRHQ